MRWMLLVSLFLGYQAHSTNLKEINEFIEKAKVTQKLLESYSQWSVSPHNPENYSFGTIAPEQQAALCRDFAQVSTADLYYVIDHLEVRSQEISCLKETVARYTEFMRSKQFALMAKFTPLPGRGTPSALLGSSQALGPSEEIVLDFTHNPVVINGHLPARTINLTFDDGPHPTRTKQLLDILGEENIQVNFFTVGSNVNLYPQTVRDTRDAGHEVGCHSFTHADLRKLSLPAAIGEIEDGFIALNRALDTEQSFFRFPYGAKTPQLQQYLSQTETTEFFWNIDTLDWKYRDPDYLLNYTIQQIENARSGVVLFHDIQPQTIAIMPALIGYFKQHDYKVVVFRPAKTRLTP